MKIRKGDRVRVIAGKSKGKEGEVIDKDMPINASNVMLIDADGHTTRVGIRIEDKDGKRTKVRFSKKTGSAL